MSETNGKPSTARRGALAMLMLALLLAAVGVGWVLESFASRRVAAATAILARIRDEELESFWPEKLTIDWYLIQGKTSPVGWVAVATGRTGKGNFAGVRVAVAAQARHATQEQWLLNADATAGVYVATEKKGAFTKSETKIDLAEGAVRVEQHVGQRIVARSPAPKNYMPEGMFETVVRRVAADRADTQFKLVFNERQRTPGVVLFDTLRIRHVERTKDDRGAWVNRVQVSGVRTQRDFNSTYELNDRGDVLRIRSDATGETWVAATQADVLRRYGNAASYLRNLMPSVLRDQAEDLLLDRLEGPLPESVGPAN